MAAEFPPELVAYIAARDAEHSAWVDRALEKLTPRERQLVREAAVMGYVQGARDAGQFSLNAIPPDRTIVWRVIDACHAMSDLHPTIGSLGDQETPTA